jgi:peptide/nickel transport system permease protein
VEDLPTAGLPTAPRHPYTRALLAAVPDLDTDRDQPLTVIAGRPPEPNQVPTGCAFAARCPFAGDRCRTEDPFLVHLGATHRVACWNPQDGAGPALTATDMHAATTGGGE